MAEERKCLHVCFPSWKFQHDTLRVLTHQISQICAGNDLNSNSKTSSYKRSEFISDRISVLGLKFISLFESNEAPLKVHQMKVHQKKVNMCTNNVSTNKCQHLFNIYLSNCFSPSHVQTVQHTITVIL